MSLTSKQVVDAISAIDKPGLHGTVAALKRMGSMSSPLPAGRGVPAHQALGDPTRSQARFLDDLDQIQQPKSIAKYRHPGENLAARPANVDGAGNLAQSSVALTDSDRAWLQRLPSVEQIPFDDARAVLDLQHRVSDKSDRRLVDTYAQPIRDYHDQAAAERVQAAAHAAVNNRPQIPGSALGALTDAVSAEHADLQPHEAAGRAADTLDRIAAQRQSDAAQRVRVVDSHIRALAEARAQRGSTPKA